MFAVDVLGSGSNTPDVPPTTPEKGYGVSPMPPCSSEAANTAKVHHTWIVGLLKEKDGSCTFGEICAKGEQMNCARRILEAARTGGGRRSRLCAFPCVGHRIRCKLEDPTVFSMLKQLKQRKVVGFPGMILEYPRHKVRSSLLRAASVSSTPELTL